MGQFYETVRKIDETIEHRGLPAYRYRGLIALKAGFSLTLVQPDTPDDPDKIATLRRAARDVLGEPV